MYVCMYVCMYVYTYVYVYIYASTTPAAKPHLHTTHLHTQAALLRVKHHPVFDVCE
jgi:hypothetical protein